MCFCYRNSEDFIKGICKELMYNFRSFGNNIANMIKIRFAMDTIMGEIL